MPDPERQEPQTCERCKWWGQRPIDHWPLEWRPCNCKDAPHFALPVEGGNGCRFWQQREDLK